MSLGKKIQQARDDAGLDAFELLIRIRPLHPTLNSTSPASLSQWENEHVDRVSFHAIDAIARVTGKPLSFFSELIVAQNGDGKHARRRHDDAASESADVLEARERRRQGRDGQSSKRAPD